MVNAVKAALQLLWKDLCTVIEYQEFTRENKSTGQQEVIVLENQPCKLSFERLQPVNQTDSAAVLVQTNKMFIDNEIVIKPGSKIIITRQGGRVFEFKQSGEVGYFSNHQEIPLIPFEDYA